MRKILPTVENDQFEEISRIFLGDGDAAFDRRKYLNTARLVHQSKFLNAIESRTVALLEIRKLRIL